MTLFVQIIRLQLLQFTRGFFSSGGRKRVLLVFVLIFPVSIFFSSRDLFQAWLTLGEPAERLFANLISTSLLGFLVFLSIGGVPFILYSLGKSGDLSFLLAAPVPRYLIFLAKVLIAGLYNSTLLFVIAAPMLIAFAWVNHASLLVYPVIVLVLLLFIQIPTFVAALLSALFLRLTSMTKARNLSTVVMGLVFALGWIAFQFLRLERLNPAASEFDPLWTSRFAALHLWLLLPSQLFARLIIHLVSGELMASLIFFCYCLAASAAAMILAGTVLDYLHRQELTRRRGSTKSSLKKVKITGEELGSVSLALVEKDLRLLWRDSRLAMSFVMLFVMMIVFPILFAGPGSSDTFMIIIFSLFLAVIVANVTSRFIPFEGKAFRLNLIFPQPLSGILVAKLIVAGALAFLPVVGAYIALMFKLEPDFITAVMMAVMLAGSAALGMSIGIALGVRFANFKYVNPRYMLTPAGSFLLPLLTAAVAVFGLAVFHVAAEWISPFAAMIIWLLYVGLFSVAGFRYALGHCKKLEWYF